MRITLSAQSPVKVIAYVLYYTFMYFNSLTLAGFTRKTPYRPEFGHITFFPYHLFQTIHCEHTKLLLDLSDLSLDSLLKTLTLPAHHLFTTGSMSAQSPTEDDTFYRYHTCTRINTLLVWERA